MTNQQVPNQLFLPVRVPTNPEELLRNQRAIEDYLNAPHRTYGARAIASTFFAEVNAVDAITIKDQGSASFGSGVWDGVQIELDRRSRAFVWGLIEVDNTDAATDYRTFFYLPVDIDGTETNGRAMRDWTPTNGQARVIANYRQVDIDVSTKSTVTFRWAVQNGSGSPQDAEIARRKMIVQVNDAPDVADEVPISWTRSTKTRTAYRTLEANDVS